MQPEVADSWERAEDGLSFTFNIHPGIKYQNIDPLNGRDFTAEDVKYAYERYQTEGVHKNYLVNAASFEVVDPLTLKINMKAPVADFIVGLGTRYLTVHRRELVDNDTIGAAAVGTGPRRTELFGLYIGTPLIDRSEYHMTLPDWIAICQGPLERAFHPRVIPDEVRRTVHHEIAHHFGFDEGMRWSASTSISFR